MICRSICFRLAVSLVLSPVSFQRGLFGFSFGSESSFLILPHNPIVLFLVLVFFRHNPVCAALANDKAMNVSATRTSIRPAKRRGELLLTLWPNELDEGGVLQERGHGRPAKRSGRPRPDRPNSSTDPGQIRRRIRPVRLVPT
jgi:hypothetical protein